MTMTIEQLRKVHRVRPYHLLAMSLANGRTAKSLFKPVMASKQP